MHYFIIQNTAVMAWWSQQVATQLPGFLNRFVRRMIQCFHKGEAASVSLTVISLSLPAFVLMSSFYIHCKLITFLNHHQAHGSLLWLLFILDCKMNCVFYIYIFMCFLSFRLPSCRLPSCGFGNPTHMAQSLMSFWNPCACRLSCCFMAGTFLHSNMRANQHKTHKCLMD